MPSGAKKRKAAKKKKENQDQFNNPSDAAAVHAHPHGDENVKGQDDVEGNVEEIEKDSKVIYPSSVERSRIEKEIKIGEELSKNEGIKKSRDGDSSASSGSGSSSSDYESHGIKKDEDESTEGPLEGSDSLSGKTDQEGSVTREKDDRNGAQHMKDTLLAEVVFPFITSMFYGRNLIFFALILCSLWWLLPHTLFRKHLGTAVADCLKCFPRLARNEISQYVPKTP